MEPDETNNLILARLDKVIANQRLAHDDMQQVKQRLSALEKQVANLGESVAAQWEHFDQTTDRLYRLENPAG